MKEPCLMLMGTHKQRVSFKFQSLAVGNQGTNSVVDSGHYYSMNEKPDQTGRSNQKTGPPDFNLVWFSIWLKGLARVAINSGNPRGRAGCSRNISEEKNESQVEEGLPDNSTQIFTFLISPCFQRVQESEPLFSLHQED